MKLLIKLLKILLLTLLLSFLLFLLFYLSGIRIFPVTFAALVSQAPLELQNEVLESITPFCLESIIKIIPTSVTTIIQTIKDLFTSETLRGISDLQWEEIDAKILEYINSKKDTISNDMVVQINSSILRTLEKCYIFLNQTIPTEIENIIKEDMKENVLHFFRGFSNELTEVSISTVENYIGRSLESNMLDSDSFWFDRDSEEAVTERVLWDELEDRIDTYLNEVNKTLTNKLFSLLNIQIPSQEG